METFVVADYDIDKREEFEWIWESLFTNNGSSSDKINRKSKLNYNLN